MSDRLSGHVDFVKTVEDASYIWLKLKHVVRGCPEVSFCACYMPVKQSRFAQSGSYECLQEDVLKYQTQGAQILICGDMNARTAEDLDYIRLADLDSFIAVPGDYAGDLADLDKLPDYIQRRQSCDKQPPNGQTWGPELLELCQTANLLILNGRTPGDKIGKYTFGIDDASGYSVVDYYIAFADCLKATQSLHVLVHDNSL